VATRSASGKVEDIQKPPVRTWLFGLIAITEMNLGRRLDRIISRI